jgi:phosphatidylglycerophosphate synthase
MTIDDVPGRRPLSSRQWPIMQRVADWLIACRVPPNVISVSSIFFGVCAACCLAATIATNDIAARLLFLSAALFIQARLLANLFDGMVAVGSGRSSPLGELFNEVPDRISDAAILIGAGYALGASPWLGYACALSAVFVAYVRAIGVVTGAGQVFLGPMAKPQRMFLMTVVSIVAALVPRSIVLQLPALSLSLVDFTLIVA